MRNALPCILACVLPPMSLAGCSRDSLPPDARRIDWQTSPLDIDLRGMDGKRYRFDCPPGKPAPQLVAGSGPYTDASSICAAAAHAGAIDAQRGGIVAIRILPGQDAYRGSTRNDIASQGYPHPWDGSFAVLTDAADATSGP